MKKILVLIISVFLLCSCTETIIQPQIVEKTVVDTLHVFHSDTVIISQMFYIIRTDSIFIIKFDTTYVIRIDTILINLNPNWTHVAVVYENKIPRLYLNGKLVRTGIASSKDFIHPSLGYDALYPKGGIGTLNSGPFFYGLMDEIRISKNVRYTSDFIPDRNLQHDLNTICLFNFDEDYGENAINKSDINNNGKMYNTIRTIDYVSGNKSVFFNGQNSYIRASKVTNVSNNFTMELWVIPFRNIANNLEGINTGTYSAPGWSNFAITSPHGETNWGSGHTGVGIEIGNNGVTVLEHSHQNTIPNLVYQGKLFK